MERRTEVKRFRDSTLARYGALLCVAGLAIVGCGGRSSAETSTTATRVAASSAPDETGVANPGTPNSPISSSELPILVFDSLGAGSSVVQVYPGVTNSDVHKVSNGAFFDGDQVTPECKRTGRKVESVGDEIKRASDQWILINGSPGLEQYATAVYVENPEQLLARLENCPFDPGQTI